MRLNFKRLMWQISLGILFIHWLSLCIGFQTIHSLGNAGNRDGTGAGFLLITSVTTAMPLDKYHLGEEIWDSSVATQ